MDKKFYGGFLQSFTFSGGISVPEYLLDHYFELGITPGEMMLIIHLLAEKDHQPGDLELIGNISRKMNTPVAEIESMIEHLAQMNLVVRVKNSTAKHTKYDFEGLIDQLFEIWGINKFKQLAEKKGAKVQINKETDLSMQKITTVFEHEIGRPLTGFECEHIEKWLTASFSQELIIEALRRGVSAGIRNFRYLDSILREWEKKGLKTLPEVQAEDEYFQSKQSKNKTERPAGKKNTGKNKSKYDNIYL
ncbi:primosome, DnaD subunit [Syntrophobotulus glycolicus DSM 8271]|uniref:Primosome, DnaD subunit n=1 Tax=Syntrophobotulus glycolicus (strain DSM 8271 / FlGlyR) TaxID=645991 RepID=F0SZK3_SYNGF|nr:primosome, DnaD subunit [Syntrophobotulus glycolicus DSM 8271]